MSKDEEIISLFEGDPNDDPLVQIWKGSMTKEVHIMINGEFLFVVSEKGLTTVKEALRVADQKNNPK